MISSKGDRVLYKQNTIHKQRAFLKKGTPFVVQGETWQRNSRNSFTTQKHGRDAE